MVNSESKSTDEQGDGSRKNACGQTDPCWREPEGFGIPNAEPLILWLQRIIHFAIRILALLMTGIILWGVADVVWMLYRQLIEPPFLLLNISDIFAIFGAFLAVLIAVEIFVNIVLYLRDDVIHVKLVMATALMAVARKAIILDFTQISSAYVYATAALILALSIGYWLVIHISRKT